MDVGTIIWLTFGALLVWGLLAKVWDWAVDWIDSVREARTAPADDRTHAQPVASRDADPGGFESDLPPWTWPKRPDPGRCPECGEPLVWVVYGFPSLALREAEERGEVILGGCVPDRGPRSACPRCTRESQVSPG